MDCLERTEGLTQDGNAIDAVWRAWLRSPDDETFQALVRWRGERGI
jgi:hypothetical protein